MEDVCLQLKPNHAALLRLPPSLPPSSPECERFGTRQSSDLTVQSTSTCPLRPCCEQHSISFLFFFWFCFVFSKSSTTFAAPDYMHDFLQFKTNSLDLYLVSILLHCQQSLSFIIRRGSTILWFPHSGQTLVCAVQSFFVLFCFLLLHC